MGQSRFAAGPEGSFGAGIRSTGNPADGPEADRAEIESIVGQVLSTMDLDLTAANLKFYAEIQSLAQFIHELKSEIATLRPDDITDEYLPSANDELEAIVGATEIATNNIFEAVENIETLTETMSQETASQVSEAVTRVYEACSFQDITGQRITKVVGALREIEQTIARLLDAFGEEIQRVPREARPDRKSQGDEGLMSGPQMPDAAMNQDDIDAILNSFD